MGSTPTELVAVATPAPTAAPTTALVAKIKLSPERRRYLEHEIKLRNMALGDYVTQVLELWFNAKSKSKPVPLNFLAQGPAEKIAIPEPRKGKGRSSLNQRGREEVLAYVLSEQLNVPQVAKRFGISLTNVRRIVATYAEGRSL